MPGAGKPLLQQRGGRRHDQKRQSHGCREADHQPQGRIVRTGKVPEDLIGDMHGQHQKRQRHQAHMEHRLATRAQPPRGKMRIRVAQQQDRLIKDEARVPHRRRASQKWQDHLAHHGLDDKQQARTEQERQRIQINQFEPPSVRRRVRWRQGLLTLPTARDSSIGRCPRFPRSRYRRA